MLPQGCTHPLYVPLKLYLQVHTALKPEDQHQHFHCSEKLQSHKNTLENINLHNKTYVQHGNLAPENYR
jgi:hypothetical protein